MKRDADGFVILEELEVLSPYTQVRHWSGCDIGEHRLVIPNEKTKQQHKTRLSKEELELLNLPVYDIDAESGSWVRKAWNIAGRRDLPSPKDSGFKDDPHYVVSLIIRIVYQLRIYSGKLKNGVSKYEFKYPFGTYGSIDSSIELNNLLKYFLEMLYKHGHDGYPSERGFFKAITIYQDGTYDTYQGNVLRYFTELGFKINTYHKKWEIK